MRRFPTWYVYVLTFLHQHNFPTGSWETLENFRFFFNLNGSVSESDLSDINVFISHFSLSNGESYTFVFCPFELYRL